MENQIFIKVEENKEVLDLIEVMKKKLEDIKANFDQIELLKKEEEDLMASWKENIKKAEERIVTIDKNIFNKGK